MYEGEVTELTPEETENQVWIAWQHQCVHARPSHASHTAACNDNNNPVPLHVAPRTVSKVVCPFSAACYLDVMALSNLPGQFMLHSGCMQ